MLKIVLGCPGIGKTTLSKKNDLFFDVKSKYFFLENKINSTKEEDSRIACKKAFENAEKNDSVLLVTGSFYLLSEVKKAL